MQEITALVVSHDRLSRQALEGLLGSMQVRVLAGLDDVDGLESGRADEKPDIVLLDYAVEPDSIDEDIERLGSLLPQSHVIILTGTPSERTLSACLTNDIAGYLSKDITANALAECMKLVMLGIRVWPTNLAAKMAARRTSLARLSKRETEVLRCLVQGDTNKEIARRLEIAEETVKTHVRALTRRVNARNRVQLAIWARASGLSGLGERPLA